MVMEFDFRFEGAKLMGRGEIAEMIWVFHWATLGASRLRR
jgi:hypothetical protein